MLVQSEYVIAFEEKLYDFIVLVLLTLSAKHPNVDHPAAKAVGAGVYAVFLYSDRMLPAPHFSFAFPAQFMEHLEESRGLPLPPLLKLEPQ